MSRKEEPGPGADKGPSREGKASEGAESAKSASPRAAADYAEESKNVAAGHLSDFAKAVRSASEDLSTRDQGVAARFVTEAADGLERVASSISTTSVDDMVGSVQAFARKNPGAFMIGAVLAGVALGRFAKSTGERHSETHARPSADPEGPAARPQGSDDREADSSEDTTPKTAS